MSTFATPTQDSHSGSRSADPARRIAFTRAVLALGWAVALFIAIGGHAPSTSTDLKAGIALLLASYPVIDVTASIATVRTDPAAKGVMSVNAAISTAAVVVIAVTGFGSDAGSALASFGAWASISGLVQLGVAIRHRRTSGGQLPMIVSGGLSTIAGITFIAQSTGTTAHVSNVAGYMAVGALLYLLWAFRDRARARPTQ